MLQIKMTYCDPPEIVWCKDEFGRPVRGRAPKSPTRPARAYEVETWWEDAKTEAEEGMMLVLKRLRGAIVRLRPTRGF